MRHVDLHIQNEGTIYLLRPVSELGQEWVAEHIPEEAMMWGDCIVVEHRFIRDIADGAEADGLVVS